MLLFENVSYAYPFQEDLAVSDISFRVRPGELVLCTGASGCGKSTLLRLANGLCPQFFKGRMQGRVTAGGLITAEAPLHRLADQVGTLLQNPEEQFFALKVEDELVFANEWRNMPTVEIERRLREVSADFGLERLLESSVHELSEGQKQKVGLASIMSQEPAVLVLDEPTANLDPEATAELGARLLALKERGLAILVVDHRLYWLEGIADRVLVMDQGRIAEQGGYALLHDDALRERYGLRRARVADCRRNLADVPDNVEGRTLDGLQVEGLGFAHKGCPPIFSGAAFALPRGVTALLGENGVGKTTLARVLTGLDKCRSGRFSMNGSPIAPEKLLRRASIVLQNADHQLYMKTVLGELATCLQLSEFDSKTHPKGGRGKRDKLAAYEQKALELLDLFDLQRLAARHPQSLSGGEKQRLVIACALAKAPELLILDEPTSGLDGRNMRRIAEALEICAAREACVLVITHDLELLELTCARALRLPLPLPGFAGPGIGREVAREAVPEAVAPGR